MHETNVQSYNSRTRDLERQVASAEISDNSRIDHLKQSYNGLKRDIQQMQIRSQIQSPSAPQAELDVNSAATHSSIKREIVLHTGVSDISSSTESIDDVAPADELSLDALTFSDLSY